MKPTLPATLTVRKSINTVVELTLLTWTNDLPSPHISIHTGMYLFWVRKTLGIVTHVGRTPEWRPETNETRHGAALSQKSKNGSPAPINALAVIGEPRCRELALGPEV